jgi:hypothetical protein
MIFSVLASYGIGYYLTRQMGRSDAQVSCYQSVCYRLS